MGEGAARPSGVLVRKEIEALNLIELPAGGIPEERCYKAASYDLRLGKDYFLPSRERRRFLKTRSRPEKVRIESCAENGFVTIPRFGSAIISTYERVKLPANVVGRFDLRVRPAFEGLIVQMGTQVEPGYEGRLYALLHNISEQSKTLKYADYETRPFTIEFKYTSQPAKVDPPTRSGDDIRSFIPHNYARGGLDQVITDIEQLQKDRKEWRLLLMSTLGAALMIAIVSAIVPFFLSRFTYEKYGFPLSPELVLKLKQIEETTSPKPASATFPIDQFEPVLRKLNDSNTALIEAALKTILSSAELKHQLSGGDAALLEDVVKELEAYQRTLAKDRKRATEASAVRKDVEQLRALLNQRK